MASSGHTGTGPVGCVVGRTCCGPSEGAAFFWGEVAILGRFRAVLAGMIVAAVTSSTMVVAAAEGPPLEIPDAPPLGVGGPSIEDNAAAEVPEPEPVPEDPSEAVAEMPLPVTDASVPAGFVEGLSVEVVDERVEYAKTYANPDGSFTTRTDVLPLHWWQDGAWVDVDTRVVPEGEGFRSASNAWTVFFPPLPGEVTIATGDGDLTFSPVGWLSGCLRCSRRATGWCTGMRGRGRIFGIGCSAMG